MPASDDRDGTVSTIRVLPDVVFRAFGDGAVLVHLADNRVFELNETGTAIWQGLVHGDSLETISSTIVGRFDVDGPEAHRAVAALVADLVQARLIESC